ncbi:hypothetical protein G3M56_013835 [Sulfuriroseicoccus oceanibius]|uniref:Uncharacterized protein n=1 Tax=Sulfuriroseicoccus oceanibius TaxID=2707525 RepID=A0A6B3L6R5_9BACT|nr:hypothetical protein G3M56_013835 [Sulfuriroseicoccus oceanibius]
MSKYRELKQGPNGNQFEVIFVSADRGPDEMIKYMRKTSMPWPALDYIEMNSAKPFRKMTGGGIPNALLVTKDGRYINSGYKNKGKGKYQGVGPVVETLEQLLSVEGGAEAVEEAAESAVKEAAAKAAAIFDVSQTRWTVAIVLASLTFLFLFFKR